MRRHSTPWSCRTGEAIVILDPRSFLISALLRRRRETGRLLLAFLLGSACTAVGAILAMALFPLTPLGEEGWRIAAALTARHIGAWAHIGHLPRSVEWPPRRPQASLSTHCPHALATHQVAP